MRKLVLICACGFDPLYVSLQVRWDRRHDDWPFKMPTFSLDGTDCHIQMPQARRAVQPVGRGGDHGYGAFFSHKTNKPALRYFLCLHICKPIIVAAGGGYPAGSTHDLVVARRDVVPYMVPDERGLADHGYHDNAHFLTPLKSNAAARRVLDPTLLNAYHEASSHVRGRHEHVNAELKEWSVLSETFRHHPEFHPECFQAVVQLTQLRLDLRSATIPPPQFAPVFVEQDDRLRILRFDKSGTVIDSITF